MEVKLKCLSTIEAVVIRKDGTRENLGVISKSDDPRVAELIKKTATSQQESEG